MKLFSKIMAFTGIFILFGTCGIFILAQNNVILIDTAHINSVVLCALGLALLCFVPSKYSACQELKLQENSESEALKARSVLILQASAGLILTGLAVIKYYLN